MATGPNLDELRPEAGFRVPNIVDGKAFENPSRQDRCVPESFDQLWDAHMGWDNYYNESPGV